MKNILLIGTGGTIASEMTDAGLTPELTPEQLLKYIPQINTICNVNCIQVCAIDSTNMTSSHWLRIAGTIEQAYSGYDGFVISHGTDTMAYTAAALSYLIQNSGKPIVLTGAQKPINSEITDSKTNLIDAFICAASDELAGVQIVFNGRIIRGTRARKTRSKSFQAFSSINYPLLGEIQDEKPVIFIPSPTGICSQPVFYNRLEPSVSLYKMVPNADAAELDFILKRKKAVIIESFGVGGIPTDKNRHFFDVIATNLQNGKTIVMTTQVQNEGSDLAIYNVGNSLKKILNVIEAYDMTTESVLAKLMWLLPQAEGCADAPEKIRRLFYTPVACDILRG